MKSPEQDEINLGASRQFLKNIYFANDILILEYHQSRDGGTEQSREGFELQKKLEEDTTYEERSQRRERNVLGRLS